MRRQIKNALNNVQSKSDNFVQEFNNHIPTSNGLVSFEIETNIQQLFGKFWIKLVPIAYSLCKIQLLRIANIKKNI